MKFTTTIIVAALLWVSNGDNLSLKGYPITISLNKPDSGLLYTLTVNGNSMAYISLRSAKLDGERFARELDQFKAQLRK